MVSGKDARAYTWADIRLALSNCAAVLATATGTANVNAAKENSMTSVDLKSMVADGEKCKK